MISNYLTRTIKSSGSNWMMMMITMSWRAKGFQFWARMCRRRFFPKLFFRNFKLSVVSEPGSEPSVEVVSLTFRINTDCFAQQTFKSLDGLSLLGTNQNQQKKREACWTFPAGSYECNVQPQGVRADLFFFTTSATSIGIAFHQIT